MATLAALGSAAYGAKSIFEYNRQAYIFDMDQRIRRQRLRLKMQVKQFTLFRDDIRDLVDLTVDRMDIYHLVGAKFLSFCIILLTKGRIQASAPPFLLSLFMLTNASAVVYLFLAVWLSMHASIAAHSFGVKLLTRFVRLPLPGSRDMRNLTFNLKDFEKGGIGNLLRVPFSDRAGFGKADVGDEPTDTGVRNAAPLSATLREAADAWGSDSKDLGDFSVEPPISGRGVLLAEACTEGGDTLLSASRGVLPDRHVLLFRELQTKWQCYDAYCRVCMGLGVNQLLQVLSYYAICHTLVENHSGSAGVALVVMFQCTTIGLAVLDLAGLKSREILVIQILGSAPCLMTLLSIETTPRLPGGHLDTEDGFPLAPWCFLSTVLWLEAWVRVAAPSQTDAGLPQRFRQMLFLDVFTNDTVGDVNDGASTALNGAMFQAMLDAYDDSKGPMKEAVVEAVKQTASSMTVAQCAVRRWSAVPLWAPSLAQRGELSALRSKLQNSIDTVNTELKRCADVFPDLKSTFVAAQPSEECTWAALPAEERLDDPFKRCIMGPFAHDGVDESYYYDVEGEQPIFEDSVNERCPGALVLSLEATSCVIQDLETDVRRLLEARIIFDLESEEGRRKEAFERRQARKKITPNPRKHFPALVDLAKEKRLGRREKKKASDGASVVANGPTASTSTADVSLNSLENDPTLSAMAGPDGQYFAPRGLPWQVLSRLTLILQLCWLWAFAMSLLKEINVFTHDIGIGIKAKKRGMIPPDFGKRGGGNSSASLGGSEGSNVPGVLNSTRTSQTLNVSYAPGAANGSRRLFCRAQSWSLEQLDVTWPHEAFFRPQSLFPGLENSLELTLSSPFALYAASLDGDRGSIRLDELGRRRMPAGATSFCGRWPGRHTAEPPRLSCRLAAPTPSGVGVWLPGADAEVLVPLQKATRRPWLLVAGAALPCRDVLHLLPGGRSVVVSCFVMAAFDGVALSLHVAPLLGDLPAADAAGDDVAVGIGEALEVSLFEGASRSGGGGAPAALLLTPAGRLWVLGNNGRLLAFDLPDSDEAGRWRLRWPCAKFRPRALAEASVGSLLVLGTCDDGRELFLRAQASCDSTAESA